ncbi:unnamed protein product [Microthlaspi erraticum]|uniref:Uncharacterized protein n=1 Tax=Microthlaspi erraticum TaxID=1685480 RepID=A0A6D2I057_9BRAS|nr:unnamed protein product [Microthlaspi erraticum]
MLTCCFGRSSRWSGASTGASFGVGFGDHDELPLRRERSPFTGGSSTYWYIHMRLRTSYLQFFVELPQFPWRRQNASGSSSSSGRAAFGDVETITASCNPRSASLATANAVSRYFLVSGLLRVSIASSLGLDESVFLPPCFSA